jgi:hypothetical protein
MLLNYMGQFVTPLLTAKVLLNMENVLNVRMDITKHHPWNVLLVLINIGILMNQPLMIL